MGDVLSFGKKDDDAPAITVTMRDVRCSMVNLDPDTASPAPANAGTDGTFPPFFDPHRFVWSPVNLGTSRLSPGSRPELRLPGKPRVV